MCFKNTSEFQGVSANDFQFDENRILESDVYDCSIKLFLRCYNQKIYAIIRRKKMNIKLK